MRRSLRPAVGLLLYTVAAAIAPVTLPNSSFAAEYRLATFSADVTPPVGHPLLGGETITPPVKRVDDPLFARGFVLLGPDKPVVVVAVDWCEIRNDAYDRWREALAEAAGIDSVRVLVTIQLFAQQLRPESFMVTMGYGECGPGYVPIERSWEERDGNLFPWCWVGPGAEQVMHEGIRGVLLGGTKCWKKSKSYVILPNRVNGLIRSFKRNLAHAMPFKQKGVYARGIAGRNQHHWHADGALVPSRASCARNRPPEYMP